MTDFLQASSNFAEEDVGKLQIAAQIITFFANGYLRAAQRAAEAIIIKDNGFGDVGGMILGMNMTQNIGSFAEPKKQSSASFDEQIEKIKKLKELVDMGIISEEEFAAKKKELLEL